MDTPFLAAFRPAALLPLVHVALALLLAPLLLGVINRVKALFGGRQGQPFTQPYLDILRLLRKGEVYSRTTTWVFRASPVVGLSVGVVALLLLPVGGVRPAVGFPGDLVMLAYLFGLARFAMVVAALDTGSAFEGMGGSREVHFAALAEPALFIGLVALARRAGDFSLGAIYGATSLEMWRAAGPELVLVAAALGVVLVCENARIPVDDPNTHLELTMIHEVMVLDHSGPGLGYILYASALKLWVYGALLVGIVVPVRTGDPLVDGAAFLLGMVGMAVVVGVVESVMARLRLVRVPQLLVGASALASLALALTFR
jgi:formate hydrogenlyase subunit 4